MRDTWVLIDYETLHTLRGPFDTAEAAGAARTEMERRSDEQRNIWIVTWRDAKRFRAKASLGEGEAAE